MSASRVGLVGVSGYSRVHLEHLWGMHAAGDVALVAAVVMNRADEAVTCERLSRAGCEVFTDFAQLVAALPRLRLDVCIVPTPIHLHAGQSVQLLHAGVNVLVEKPLAATVAQADAVADAARKSGKLAAVGFQYLHAAEVRALKERLIAGDIGRVQRISVYASWPRGHGYYRRNDWAGRLQVAEGAVLDSPVANAMAHFFLLSLFFAGATLPEGARVQRMTAELYRAQEIESFDTAVISMTTESGCILDFYGTHSSRQVARPALVIQGELGRAEWMQDSHAMIARPDHSWRKPAAAEPVTRDRMLRDVLAAAGGADRFVCRPELAREHVRCVNALHAHVPITDIPGDWRAVRQEQDEVFTYVRDLDGAMAAAFARRSGLGAGGTPWAVRPTEFAL